MKTISITVGLVCMAICLTFSSCNKEEDQITGDTDLAHNYRKWQSFGLSNYQFTESLNCFCIVGGPHRIVVKNKAIIFVKSSNGATVPLAGTGFKTIDELFEFARESLARNPYIARITYNPTYGYPESVYFDFDRMMADEEIGYSVSNFVR